MGAIALHHLWSAVAYQLSMYHGRIQQNTPKGKQAQTYSYLEVFKKAAETVRACHCRPGVMCEVRLEPDICPTRRIKQLDMPCLSLRGGGGVHYSMWGSACTMDHRSHAIQTVSDILRQLSRFLYGLRHVQGLPYIIHITCS